jgi:hypothetical protein
VSLIGIVNSDSEVREKIEQAFADDKGQNFILRWASSADEVEEMLNFELPELVVFNAHDKNIDFDALRIKLLRDSWIHNFGVIAVFSRKTAKENDVAQQFHDLNIITLIDQDNLKTKLFKFVKIIEKNRQIIFQTEMMNTKSRRITGSFLIDNDALSVPIYAGLAATILVQRSLLSVENKRSLQIALAELIMNGIEHGNCKLTFEEKNAFLHSGGAIHELIQQKCNEDPEIARRKVHLEWDIRPEETKFYIRDEGDGFDVEEYRKKIKDVKTDELHGRGIIVAKSIGGKLSYNTKGSTALLTLPNEVGTYKSDPKGFSGEEVLLPKKGDIIFRQGDISDYIYYISSGQYSVYHNDTVVGVMTPADIFMGEMSFLLNNHRSATVIAETDGKIIKISRKSFVQSIRSYPQYGLFLSKLLARKVIRANQTSSVKKEKI